MTLIAEVEVDRKLGKVQVRRVLCAQDMGLAINPEGATIQMEGCITMGMGAVVANAVFDATGARLLELPMTPERVKESLEKHG